MKGQITGLPLCDAGRSHTRATLRKGRRSRCHPLSGEGGNERLREGSASSHCHSQSPSEEKRQKRPPPRPRGFIPEQGTRRSGEPRGLQPSHAREETSIVWKQLLTARPVRVCAGGRGQGAPGRVPGAPRARSWRRAAGEGRGTVPPPEQSAGGAGVSKPVFDSELDLPPGALPGFPPPEETPVSGFCGRSLARALAGPPSRLLPHASPGGPESSGGWRWALALGDSPAVGGMAALRAASAAPASPELQACDLLAI